MSLRFVRTEAKPSNTFFPGKERTTAEIGCVVEGLSLIRAAGTVKERVRLTPTGLKA